MDDFKLVMEFVCQKTVPGGGACQVTLADGRVVQGSPTDSDDFSLPGIAQISEQFYDRFLASDHVKDLLGQSRPFLTSVFCQKDRRRYAMRWSIS